MSYLSDWSETLDKIARERREGEDRALAAAEAEFPAKSEEIRALSSADVLEHFESYVCRSYPDSRMTALSHRMAQVCRDELLARLAGTGPRSL